MKYRHPRRAVDTDVAFLHDGEVVEARVRDISRFGMRVEGDFYFGGSENLALLYAGRKFWSRFVWMRFGMVGVVFDEPLDKDTYAALLGQRRGGQGTKKKKRFMMT